MESIPRISGKEISPEDRAGITQRIEAVSKEGLDRIDGELEKTAEAEEFIGVIGRYLNDELTSLGLSAVGIDAQRIHVITANEFAKKFPGAEANGVYTGLTDGIYVRGNAHRMQLYKTMVHEMVHQAAFRAYHADKNKKKYDRVRQGYTTWHPHEKHHEHFRGLDEAIVDRTVMDILRGHKEELIHRLHITEEEAREPVNYYHDYLKVLAAVINKISEKKNENVQETWKRFKRSEFNGELMHLRDIEDVFGKGSLRVLAALGSGTRNPESPEETRLVLEYFSSDDSQTRDHIARSILNGRERARYIKRTEPILPQQHASFFGALLRRITTS